MTAEAYQKVEEWAVSTYTQHWDLTHSSSFLKSLTHSSTFSIKPSPILHIATHSSTLNQVYISE
jgi:hypothetical protein